MVDVFKTTCTVEVHYNCSLGTLLWKLLYVYLLFSFPLFKSFELHTNMGMCDLQQTYYKYVLNLHNTTDDTSFLVPFPYWFGRTFLPFSYRGQVIPHQSSPTDAEKTFGKYLFADCLTDALV